MQPELFLDLAHQLMAAQQVAAMYPERHPRVDAAVAELHARVADLVRDGSEIRIALAEQELVVDDAPVPLDSDVLRRLAQVMARQGATRIVVAPGVRDWELSALVEALSTSAEVLSAAGGIARLLEARGVRHVAAGPARLATGVDAGPSRPLAAAWDIYSAGLTAVRRLRSRLDEGITPQAMQEATRLAAALAGTVQQHPDVFILLQQLKVHDEYTYTHSLNVTMLSLVIAQGLDVPAEHHADIALAALLHDIGKELVPSHVLNKPGRLTDEEWQVMQRHSADGAKMLLRSAEAGGLPVVVAYEHQLAYENDNPDHGRWPLHFVSQLVCIPDVYDALRSHRPYRAALPSEVAMRIMEQEVEDKFDADLFAGFRRMLGYYPPGTVVELPGGALAIATRANPDAPDRPQVAVVRDEDGNAVEPPLPIDLSARGMSAPLRSVDPDAAGLDPFDYF